MIETEQIASNEEIERKVRSAFPIQDPDQIFIDRLQKKLADRFNDVERSSESKNIFSRPSRWLNKSKFLLSPLSLGAIGLIFILILAWGIKTLIPSTEPAVTIQPLPSPTVSITQAIKPTQAETNKIIQPTPSVIVTLLSPTESRVGGSEIGVNLPTLTPTRTIIPTLNPNAITNENAAAIIQLGTLDSYRNRVRAIAFSPDGKLLASAHGYGDEKQSSDIILWNLETKTEYLRLTGHHGVVNTVAFNPNGGQLASGGTDGTVRLWNTTTGDTKIILKGYPTHEGMSIGSGENKQRMLPVLNVAYSPDGTLLAVGGGDLWGPGWLELYNPITGKRLSMLDPSCSATNAKKYYMDDLICYFPYGMRPVYDMAFSPDGTLLATASTNGVLLWDIENKQKLRQLVDPRLMFSLAFSPDGKIIAAGNRWIDVDIGESFREEDMSGEVHFWDVKTGEMLDLFDVGENSVYSIGFSPNGKILVVGRVRSVELWDMATGNRLVQIDNGYMPVIAYSLDGSQVAIGDWDGIIRLWGVPSR